MSRYQKGKTNLDFTEARDSEWQWHQLGHMQVCTSLQTENHTSTPPLSFLQAGCPSCRPTNSVKALKATRSSAEPCKQIRHGSSSSGISFIFDYLLNYLFLTDIKTVKCDDARLYCDKPHLVFNHITKF